MKVLEERFPPTSASALREAEALARLSIRTRAHLRGGRRSTLLLLRHAARPGGTLQMPCNAASGGRGARVGAAGMPGARLRARFWRRPSRPEADEPPPPDDVALQPIRARAAPHLSTLTHHGLILGTPSTPPSRPLAGPPSRRPTASRSASSSTSSSRASTRSRTSARRSSPLRTRRVSSSGSRRRSFSRRRRRCRGSRPRSRR